MNKLVNTSNYKPRIIYSVVEKKLRIFGAICIKGSKWCKKAYYEMRYLWGIYFTYYSFERLNYIL